MLDRLKAAALTSAIIAAVDWDELGLHLRQGDVG
jgi:hypothetical protein